MKNIRVRIAPSPTGYPHIGTIWQALINFAFARHFKGKFIVRIEDTDQKRLVSDAQEKLFQSLAWFGLEPDESVMHGGEYGPYRQSERLDIYEKHAEELVNKGKAYYCTCSAKRLTKVRQEQQKKGLPPMYDKKCRDLNLKKKDLKNGSYVIRLKVPSDKKIIVPDLLRGQVEFDSNTIDDQVLIKSDGFPTYHLAVVVDDHLMKISHMVRGEEWLPSAPKNILLYDYFKWKKPVFIHTPALRNPDKSKLSKRQGHTAASWYQERFLKEAILNYLSLLGWSHPQEKEIFNLNEFIKLFDLKDLSVSGPVFDINKLTYINGLYLRKKSNQELKEILKKKAKHLNISDAWWKQIIPFLKDRIKNLSQKSIDFWLMFFKENKREDIEFLKKQAKDSREQLDEIYKVLESVKEGEWSLELMQKNLLSLVDGNKDRGWKRSKFFSYLRIAIAGRKISLPLMESMEILGKKECLKRVAKTISLL